MGLPSEHFVSDVNVIHVHKLLVHLFPNGDGETSDPRFWGEVGEMFWLGSKASDVCGLNVAQIDCPPAFDGVDPSDLCLFVKDMIVVRGV